MLSPEPTRSTARTIQKEPHATLVVVWVGLPRDEELTLAITAVDGRYRLILVQAAPPADSDAIGFDRVLDLRFESPVSASDVDVTIEVAPAG